MNGVTLLELEQVEIDNILYYPVMDTVDVGIGIEEVIVRKIIGRSKGFVGRTKLLWHYGCLDNHKERRRGRNGCGFFIIRNGFTTIKDCLEDLKLKQNELIKSIKNKELYMLEEITLMEQLIRESRLEYKNYKKIANKNKNMLSRLDIEQHFQKLLLI